MLLFTPLGQDAVFSKQLGACMWGVALWLWLSCRDSLSFSQSANLGVWFELPVCFLSFFFFFFNFNVYLFLRERESTSGGGSEREGDTESEEQTAGPEPSAQSPMRGSNSQTVRSWPELKPDAQPTGPPRRPNLYVFFTPVSPLSDSPAKLLNFVRIVTYFG